MSSTIIKSGDSDNQAKVDSTGHLLVSGTVDATNPSVSPTGGAIPASATLVGGIDPSGNLKAIKVDSSGALITSVGPEGFSILSAGYPNQVSIGTTSVEIFPSNPLRKYAHIFNNSSESIYIQFSSAAAINQGIKVGPGSFFTLDTDNLWLGVVNGIGLMSGQLIDRLEGE